MVFARIIIIRTRIGYLTVGGRKVVVHERGDCIRGSNYCLTAVTRFVRRRHYRLRTIIARGHGFRGSSFDELEDERPSRGRGPGVWTGAELPRFSPFYRLVRCTAVINSVATLARHSIYKHYETSRIHYCTSHRFVASPFTARWRKNFFFFFRNVLINTQCVIIAIILVYVLLYYMSRLVYNKYDIFETAPRTAVFRLPARPFFFCEI